ncbi:hypothetical protein Tco_1011015 [Tanacetum coccineum]
MGFGSIVGGIDHVNPVTRLPLEHGISRCSWGSKPTPPGTSSNPLPEPAPAPMLSAADLLAYERQLAMSKMAGVHAALMHPQAQLPLKQTMGMNGTGASQAIYDGGFQNVAAAQQLMYYQ